MVIFGIDAHKRSHTVVAIDEQGRKLAERATSHTATADHIDLLRWATRFGADRLWAVEDCRHLSRRLESDLLAAGEKIIRVPPKLMAHPRDGARTYGKSDPIDALAIARAALREPDLPAAHLDEDARQLRLLVDHREDLLAERTRHINRLRWHLHEIDPQWDPKPRAFGALRHIDAATDRLVGNDSLVAAVARDLLARVRGLTIDIRDLEKQIADRASQLGAALLAIPGVGALLAGKILAEVAGVTRFKSRHAFARHNGTAPLPAWSGNRIRHRLSRSGNRQLNAALHRIAITQARAHPEAIAYLERRRQSGNTTNEALRALKRRLSDVVYRALLTDAAQHLT